MKNILIGAISGNYSIGDIQNWVRSAKRVLTEKDQIYILAYNYKGDSEVIRYLLENQIEVLMPEIDMWGNSIEEFETNTGLMNTQNSYKLIHNIRFLHIWWLLSSIEYNQVLITDVKDVIINKRPFTDKDMEECIVASSEVIKYGEHQWNKEHILQTFGLAGIELLEEEVNNVGVLLGKGNVIKSLCLDIYLNAINKTKVADQTGFNYLIRNSYRDKTVFTGLEDKWAVHLHVINEGLIPFDLHELKNYTIIHQYDRLGDEIFNYYTIPQ
jgi:hypothetical protein